MRIEKVAIENINSLYGRFEIDFTDSEYSLGLFAIVGPSGAGKSTVLDAVCLALYGRTPRITVSDMHNEAMNHSADSCRAEVVFVSSGKRYLGVFEHRRTIRSAKPFMSAKNEIYECLADGTNKALSDNSTQTRQKVIEIIGLDYDQFTRSVMLAQFRFAEFLSAKPNERAAILEQVSGTDIYRRISTAVYQKQKSFDTKLKEINIKKEAVSVLSPEQEGEIQVELKEIDDKIVSFEALSESLKECTGALGEQEKQQKALSTFEEKRAAIAKEKQQKSSDFEEAGKAEKEQRAITDELRKTLVKVRGLDLKISAQQKEISRLSGEINSAETSVLDQKKYILGILKKHLPQADNEKLKELYESQNEADIITKHISDKLKDREDSLKAQELELVKILQGKSEKDIIAELERIEQAAPLLNAKLAAEEASEELKKLRENLTILQANQKKTEKQVEQSEEKFLFAQLQLKFADERNQLQDGKPCPLCGALHHPGVDKQADVSFMKQAEEEKSKLKQKMDRIYSDITQINFAVATQVRIISNSEEALKGKEELMEAVKVTDIEGLEKRKAEIKQKLNDIRNIQEKISGLSSEILELTKKLGEVDKDVSDIRHAKAVIADIEKRIALYEKERITADGIRKELSEKRIELFTDKDPDQEEEKQQRVLAAAEQNTEKTRRSLEETKNAEAGNAADIERTKEALKALEQKINSSYSDVCTKGKAVHAVLDEQDELQKSLAVQIDSFEETAQQSVNAMNEALYSLGSLSTSLKERKGEARITLNINEQNKKKLTEFVAEEKEASKQFKKWSDLSSLIGSADGSKFARIAQGITFDVLLVFANESLKKMSDRYILIRDDKNQSNPLEINVVDNYQAGEIRPISNLSGGESFVVSLALALGLSEMSSGRTLIDSLFIDEGFASLDENYLELALQTLSTIGNRQNKLIGVISHVKELKERIDTQIEVTPLTGGRSTIKGPGVKMKELS